MKIVHAWFIAAAAALSLATASAQTYGGFPGGCRGMGCGTGYGPGSHMGYGPGYGPGPGYGYGDATVVTRARLDDLRARLQITPDQEGAWHALADAMLQQATRMDEARTTLFDSRVNAAQRMLLRSRLMTVEADAFETVALAFGALYGLLNDEQRLVLERQWGFGMGPGWGRPGG